jgi:two-component system, sensor histidine kinase and response regulator
MDMQMPVLEGLGATRAIRFQLGDDLPIVAITANAFAEDEVTCLAAGMNDYIAKPIEVPKLYACVLKWLLATSRMDALRGSFGPPAVTDS